MIVRFFSLLVIAAINSIGIQGIAIADPRGSAHDSYGSPTLKNFIVSRPPIAIITPFTEISPGCERAEFEGVTWQGGRWKHPLLLCTPKDLQIKDAVLLRVSGTNTPEKYAQETLAAAERSKAFVAVLGGVPNQPLFGGKKEDVLLAHSFEQYRKTGDTSWPVLLPMVGSVVSALDVLETTITTRHKAQTIRAVITGASKRGWTTWLSPIVDKRIIGIAPAVFDMLDIPKQVPHARNAYGADSRMIRAYTELGLTDRLKEPRMQELLSMIDPISYAKQLDLPKYLVLGTNDPYWVVDSLTLYEKELRGNTLIGMQPNVGHGALGTPTGLESVTTWFSLLAAKTSPPIVKAELTTTDTQATVTLTSDTALSDLKTWSAEGDDQDFRLSNWSQSEEPSAASTSPSGITTQFTYTATIPRPRFGKRAIVVEGYAQTPYGGLRVTSPAYVADASQGRKPFEDL